jgi:hypothetical protein
VLQQCSEQTTHSKLAQVQQDSMHLQPAVRAKTLPLQLQLLLWLWLSTGIR